jgi:hypothetical protein
MNIKIEGCKVTIHNKNGDRLELNSEFESEFFKEYDNKQLIIADVVSMCCNNPKEKHGSISKYEYYKYCGNCGKDLL